MMKQFLMVVLVLTLQLVGTQAMAQDIQRITFAEVVDIVLDRSTAIRSSGYSLELESSRVSSARADFLPNLNAGINPSANFGLTFDQNSLQLVNRTSYFSNVGLSSTLNLFRGFGDVAQLEQARHRYDAADFTLDRTKQDVLQQAIINYLQVIQDRENVKIQDENVRSQTQLLERIEEFSRVGTRPISDLYTQQANTAQAELDLLNAERSAQLSQARLVGQLLLDPLRDYEFVAPSSDEVDLSPIQYDPVSLIQNAYDQRLDLHAQNSRIEAAEQGVRTAKSLYWPVVNLIGQYGSSYSSSDHLDRPIFEQTKDNRSGSIRVGLTIPIFNRLDNKFNVQQSQVVERNARLDLETLQQRVALEVRQSYLDYQTAVKQLEVSDRRLRAAQQALDAEQERYNVGASTLIELTQVQAIYVSAASSRINSVVNYVARVALIDYFVGTISPDASIF
jgi:outer membrane protein